MTDPVKPALTPEEWAEVADDREYFEAMTEDAARTVDTWFAKFKDDNQRHALAALALHGQPFGFTREDVRLLRERAERDEEVVGIMGGGSYASPFRAIAARIEALLPPAAK